MVHCSRDGTVHRYGERGEVKWLYFDQAKENYEVMHQMDGGLLVASSGDESNDENEDEMPELEAIVQRHTMPWTCGKCAYVNAGSEAGFLMCGAWHCPGMISGLGSTLKLFFLLYSYLHITITDQVLALKKI